MQILVAMEHLHKLGFVHRNFKLEHILLRDSGSVVLGELSLAQPMDAFKKITQMCGTAEYCSPEMISGRV
jgi:serine/threonine protein kinase